LAFNSAGDLFESDNGTENVNEFTPGGTESTFATLSSSPNGLAFNSTGDLFVSGGFAGNIIEFPHSGGQSTFASGLGDPAGLVFQPIPEPTTLALLGIGAAVFFARRHRKQS
jgi:hypothetical protein